MLHMIKLVVGCATIDELAARMQHERVDGHGFVRTRTMPRQADEILGGGSLYRVMNGTLICRQPIAGFRAITRPDGQPGTLILVTDEIIPVMPRAMRPFQGWRYLKPDDAPADLGNQTASGIENLPPNLRRELADLGLI
ncbi:DUF1489 family protein [Kozakia baliensis]|uniref:Uncharacterized protein n=1 Tax=Kozakia baliensis TaxID=153496 RepID=A0A1D8URB2_9PROT|nr:DUF1489 domain-containing protein [Kozakia baliensis]AOX16183.1 hypothetical protein A0U89_02525 [Kozakia baliensis]GEL63788.1 lysophospholipase [Kozakia baliensis]